MADRDHGATPGAARSDPGLPELTTLARLAALVAARPGLYLRWSRGPRHDAEERSRDHASGLELPGLAVNPLTPPTWWTLPIEQWVARQARAYAHLGEDQPGYRAWVLTGRVVERGPDNEPLVSDVEPVAWLSPLVLEEAATREPRSPRERDQNTSWRS